MSNSAKLRKTQTEFGGGRSIFNEEAKSHEANVFDTTLEVRSKLRNTYGDKFYIEKQLSKYKIAEKLGIKNYNPEGSNPFVKPDGGILYYIKNSIHYPILITEAKKQGTNDIRELEGKPKQGKGNAIERAYKNSKEFELYCRDFPIFPYVVFACGCDFAKGSSINDRLDAMTDYLPRNKIYVGTNHRIVNLFVQVEAFTKKEIFDIMYNVAKKSIKVIEDLT